MPRKKKEEKPVEEAKGEMINWYTKIPEEMLDKTENPNHHLHGINLPFRMCVSAPSGSG